MDIRHLIDLLPPIFKVQDTYRVNGKGFLERYLEICGNYLTDIITPDIDNILDIIQIDTTPKEYLNYLWEFLGEMPFANIYNVDKAKWDLNYDGTNMNEDIWLIENNKPIALNDKTARDLIRYSLSLYKIRGTKKFFDIVLRLYGMRCTITHDNPDYEVITPYLDNNHIDLSNLDIDYRCKQCSNIIISLYDEDNESVLVGTDGVILIGTDDNMLISKNPYISDIGTREECLVGTDGVILIGTDDNVLSSNAIKYYGIKELILAYNNYSGNIDFEDLDNLPVQVKVFVSLRRLLESFFDRFIPYNSKVQIKYDGILPDDGIKFNVVYDDPDNSIITRDNPTVSIKLIRDSKWPLIDMRYQVSRNNTEWNGVYHSEGIYRVNNPGTYHFKLVSSNIVIPVSVGISMIQQQYSLSINEGNIIYLTDFDGGIATITPIAKLGNTMVGTTIVFPDGNKYNFNPNSQVGGIYEPGQYKVYITNNPGIYTTVYVYTKPYSSNSFVGIPYGIRVTYIDSLGGSRSIGGPDNDKAVPVLICTSKYEIVHIEPWLRDPNDPSKVLYGSEFITDPEHVICFLIRQSDDDQYSQIDNRGDYLVPEPVSISGAKDMLNNMLELTDTSALLTLAQVNITPHYDPYSIDQSSQQTRFNYLHNPIVINAVSELSDDYIEFGPSISEDSISLSNGAGTTTEDVFILGAILFDNRYTISNFYIWDSNSPYNGFRSPYYTATLQLSNIVQEVDLSDIKFRDSNGNTIRRQVVVLGRTNLNLVNTVSIFISDTSDISQGLYITPVGEDTSHWSEEILPSPLPITRSDGSITHISRIYTVKLNNFLVGKQVARFKLQVVFGGIYYDDISDGGIVVDDKGNPYNLRTTYIEDTIRYYIPRDDGNPLVLGGHGHIFSVKSMNSADFNVMLNVVIDDKAPDKLDIKFSIDPEIFYLPTNGQKAITNMIASRPYKFEPGSDGVFIFGPLEYETEDNWEELVRNPIYEYITKNTGSYTFSSEGIVDPLSILAGAPEYPGSSEEKVFTVYKNK